MILSFPFTGAVSDGHYPSVVHMMDNTMHIFYVDDNGDAHGMSAMPTAGQYGGLTWEEDGRASADRGVSYPRLKKVQHRGAMGFWGYSTMHRFVLYSPSFDLTGVLRDGTITISKDSPIVQLSLSLANINGAFLGQYRSAVTPFSKITIAFQSGDSSQYDMGVFYSDKVSGKREEMQISLSARNAIGKWLKDQTFDESNTFTAGTLADNLRNILAYAGLTDYFVADTASTASLEFDADKGILDGISEIIEMLDGWKIEEIADGTIGIAPSTDARFDQPATHSFTRGGDCWSCEVEEDDTDTYSRLCVRRNNYGTDGKADNPTLVWRELEPHDGWSNPPHKTYFYDAPDGASDDDLQAYADKLAETLPLAGKKETFVGIFKPYLSVGDTAEVTEEDGTLSVVGVITDIKHSFGQSGYYTEFTVDSSGRSGKVKLLGAIKQALGVVSKSGTGAAIVPSAQDSMSNEVYGGLYADDDGKTAIALYGGLIGYDVSSKATRLNGGLY